MIKYILFVIPFLLIFSLIKLACGELEFKPKLKEIKNIEILSLSGDSLIVNFEVDIQNDNAVDISLSNTSLSFYHLSKSIGTAEVIKEIKLNANSVSTLQVKCAFETKKILPILNTKQDSIPFKVKGITHSDFIFSQSFDIEAETMIPVKEMMDKIMSEKINTESLISIEGAYLKDLGLSSSKVEVKFNLKNPYDISIIAEKYPSKLYINNSYSGEGDLTAPIKLNNKSKSASGSIIYSVKNSSAFSSIFSTLLSGKLEYKISGVLSLKIENNKVKLPFEHKGVLIKL